MQANYPWLAFQKIMQAHWGNQLKISGNVVNVPTLVAYSQHPLPQETGRITGADLALGKYVSRLSENRHIEVAFYPTNSALTFSFSNNALT